MIAEMSTKPTATTRKVTNVDCGPIQIKKFNDLTLHIRCERVSYTTIVKKPDGSDFRMSGMQIGPDDLRPHENILGQLSAVLDKYDWTLQKKTLKALMADLTALSKKLEAERPLMYSIRDLPKDAKFVSDSQDVQPIREHVGNPAMADYDSFFVVTKDGDYAEVYGYKGIVPKEYGDVRRFV